MTYEFPTIVVTTEPLLVRRTDADGDARFEVLDPGARCELVCEDAAGTFVLVDEHGDEVWRVHPVQFRPTD